MYTFLTHYPETFVTFKDTLADLLNYWQRGLLSDEEMVRCWHKCRLNDEQVLQQLIELAVVPAQAAWWGDA